MEIIQADNKHLETVCNQLGLTPGQFNREVEAQRKRMYSHYGIEDKYVQKITTQHYTAPLRMNYNH